MKKNVVSLIGILAVMSLTACSNKSEASEEASQNERTDAVSSILQSSEEDAEGTSQNEQADAVNSISQISKEAGEADADETDADGKEDTVYDVLDSLVGEYSYTSDDRAGKLMIQKTSDGYDISDYDSESSYRFLADSSNIQTIEGNRIYIEYPELFSDDTVHFSYYILEYSTDGIGVYYGMTAPENAEFLYHAVKRNDKNTEDNSSNDYSENASADKFIDYEALGIKAYEYPSEFIMGDNLKTAIAQLALNYVSFNSDTPRTGGFKETFIAEFIQNSRLSFDYLDFISDKNNGLISIDELNYIQYSLTNTKLDFSTFVSGSINRYDAASPLCSAWVTGYDYKDTDNGALITADLEVGYDGTEDTQKYEVTAELVRNPYSCFDGYSIAALSSTIADNMQGDTNLSAAEEVNSDLYEGEYCSYDVNEPALEIKKNDDGTYQIQIDLFRLWGFEDEMGKMTEDGLELTATGPGGNEVDGIIKLEGDIAKVTIFGQEWLDFAGLSEYKFYKTSDVSNISDFLER